MNSKMLIGAVVGGLIVFIWQFLSWALINFHKGEQKYTPNQDTILQVLSTQLGEEGTYFLPNTPPGTSSEDQQKAMESQMGKPWAQISYHKSMSTDMGMNMFRGYLTDVVAVLLLIWLLMKIPTLNMQTDVLSCIVVGVIGYLTTEYTNSIWFEKNTLPDLLDAVVSWTLCGAWLGFWLRR